MTCTRSVTLDSTFQTEPICKALGGIDSKGFDFWVHMTAVSGLSFEAIDTRSGKRVGAYLCTIYENGVDHEIDKQLAALDGMDPKMKKLAGLLDGMHEELRPQIFKKFNVDKYLEGVNLSVLPGYTGMGIAGKMTQAIEDKARELKIPLVYVACSSEFTAKLCQRRGYELIHTLLYKDHKENGERVFYTDEPHEGLKCYVKLVN